MKTLKQQNELYWLLALSVICFGGFYDWTAALLGAAVAIVILLGFNKTQKISISKEKWIWLIVLQEVCLIFSMFTAIDRGMNLIGIVRFFPVLGWMILCMQYTEKDRKQALDAITDMGCATVAVGIVSLIVPQLKPWFWVAERFGGFFQYSNTSAIFFLLGLMLLQGKDSKKAKIKWCMLFWGILLTGSRTVMILMLFVLSIQLLDRVFVKEYKYLIAGNLLVAVIVAVGVVGITGSFQNIARLATVFSSNSTFYGRVLYWKDALVIIMKHPLGLGWKGYYYIQPAVQTGVYTTMYVHNDLLQAFLDGGWSAGMAMAAFMIMLLKKSNYRDILFIVFLHCMVDIDLQYTTLWFVVILMADFGKETIALKKKKSTIMKTAIVALILCCSYMILPLISDFFGDYQTTLRLYPWHTETKENILSSTGNADVAISMADDILEQNEYSSLAYDAKALAAFARGDIESFILNKEKVLSIERYDITHYRDYDYLLERWRADAELNGDTVTMKYCEERHEVLVEMLEKVKRKTSIIAWKLRDKPDFNL